MTPKLYDLSAVDLSQAYRKKELSPVEVTRAVLDRINSWEPMLNAMYIIDAEGALAQASASEKRWSESTPLSPIDGVPITIKDIIATKGDPLPVGTAAADFTPVPADQPPAARIREAGCVIIGKTTMPDFGMLASGVSSLHGITRNPWNTDRNTSGSSSGAGAAIAAGYGPLALGTDIGGSVRLPAAYNGIFALKPSLGRIPIFPPYLGRVTGPMTRTVRDAALLMNVLTRPDPRDFMALPYDQRDWTEGLNGEVRGRRIGLLIEIGAGTAPQAAVRQTIENAARTLEQAGAVVESVAPFVTDEMLDGLDLFFQARLWAEIERFSSERKTMVLPFIIDWCRRAAERSAADAVRALNQIMLIREKAVATIQGYHFLISPTSPITAYAAEEPAPGSNPLRPFDHIVFTAPFNMSEQPAASICAGYDEDGLPIGLQIVGHRFDDAGVLQLANAYETLRPAVKPWPEPV